MRAKYFYIMMCKAVRNRQETDRIWYRNRHIKATLKDKIKSHIINRK